MKKEGKRWINSCDEDTDSWVPVSMDSCPTTIITKQDSAAEGKSWSLDFEFATFGQDSETAISDSVTKC